MQIEQFESGLAAMKLELEDTDRQIAHTREKAEELKQFVKDYNALKQKEADLKKSRRSILHSLQLLTDFYKRVTGAFPDGMFPLFGKDNILPSPGVPTTGAQIPADQLTP